LIKLFETLIDPIFPIVGSVVLEEPRGTYASGNQMVPTSYLRIHKPKSSRSHFLPPKNQHFDLKVKDKRKSASLQQYNACPFLDKQA